MPGSRVQDSTDQVGSFQVIRTLATGGTSDILLARSSGPHGFERTVVLKCLDGQHRPESDFAKMFMTEATAYSRLSDASIVKLFDFFSHDERLVMVLEHVDGLTLRRLRASAEELGIELSDRAVLYVAGRIFAALACAHGSTDEAGKALPIVHRDVNPSNVLVSWDGEVKLADFGVARVTGLHAATVGGAIKGSLGYMAPEQVQGGTITPATDVYGAGIVLWEMLTKRRAFAREGGSDVDVLRAMSEPKIPSIDELRLDLDKNVRELVTATLEPYVATRTLAAARIAQTLSDLDPEGAGRAELVEVLRRVREKRSAKPDATPKAAKVAPPALPSNVHVAEPTPTEKAHEAEAPAPPKPPAGETARKPPMKRRPSGLGPGLTSPLSVAPGPNVSSSTDAPTPSPAAKVASDPSATSRKSPPPPTEPAAPPAPVVPTVREAAPPRPPSIAPPPELELADNGLYVPTSIAAPASAAAAEVESMELLQRRRAERAKAVERAKADGSHKRAIAAMVAVAIVAAGAILFRIFSTEAEATTPSHGQTKTTSASSEPPQVLPERSTSVTTTPLVTLFEATSTTRQPILVEGVLIGETPLRVEVPCGTRAIQIGNDNPVRTLDLPCGKVFSVHEK
ncbi:MAG: serine/threonine-protein kinase [Polyangiaceae bacterium]